MIQFPCTCDHLFTVDDDRVGEDIQCPDCGKLNTVPTAADLDLLNNDGTYRVDGVVEPEQPNVAREAELKRIFVKGRQDEYGNDIDLRSHATPLDYQRVGVEPIDLMPDGGERPAAPKYDPETGELIRPLEVKSSVITAARRSLPPPRKQTKRVAVERLTNVSPHVIWAKMFLPSNLIVLTLLLALHVVFLASVMIGTALIFVFVLSLFVGVGLIAHFGNVIDETGPSNRDELPRPFRNLGWSEDLWGPFWAFLLSAGVCYGPTYLALTSSMTNTFIQLGLAGTFLILGTIAAPAVILITQTSGSIANLRPDRIFSTIRGCAAIYPLLVFFFIISVPTYIVGFLGLIYCGAQFVAWALADISKAATVRPPAALAWIISIAALCAGIWLFNFFVWVLGRTYRVYHRRFGWEYQGKLSEDGDADDRGFAVLPAAKTESAQPTGPLEIIPLPRVQVLDMPVDYAPAPHHPNH